MPGPSGFTTDDLIQLAPKHPTFVGVDSDGCVFDTMELKQKQCFHPLIISHWHLERIETCVREAAEFVNLYSQGRGRNRFPCLIDVIDLLRDRPEVVRSGVAIPELRSLRAWVESGVPLGNPTLQQAVEDTGNEELADVLAWSRAVNARVAEEASGVRPFQWAVKGLERIRADSDVICVSQTPSEALIREWEAHDLARHVAVIAGQELGTKAEHIRLATQGKYEPGHVLMIGDAPGDERAARANHAHFYPINPAHEEESWERFCKEAYDRFLAGDYGGDYENETIAQFHALLPHTPPWLSS
jgi:phosphoglycolate phosphatase-like HAD superfamily hydrolase